MFLVIPGRGNEAIASLAMNDVQANPDGPAAGRKSQTWLWAVFGGCALACIGLFFVPAFIIRPFTHQSARGLVLAMAIRRYAPALTLLTAAICGILLATLWSNSRWWKRTVLVVSMVVVAFSAVMARMNYFEWMFHPVATPGFEAESQSKLDDKEMVLAVKFGSDARAYPIREMAYHHIVNDVVGGVPIAATY